MSGSDEVPRMCEKCAGEPITFPLLDLITN